MVLRANDLLLTASAHSPAYIAKKIDIVTQIPEWTGGKASYVGEVMLLRPDPEKIDPFVLLSFLRLPKNVEKIQHMIRGQTAHLHSEDIMELPIDPEMLSASDKMAEMAELVRREAELNDELNEIAWRQMQAAEDLSHEVSGAEVAL
jgi:type I restriction enzyme M protein